MLIDQTHAESLITVGIDVGGTKKGYHAAALKGGKSYLNPFWSTSVSDVVNWCRHEAKASAIAIDAPSAWSLDGRARPAERLLMHKKIWCFATPDRLTALSHPRKHFGWMLQGERLIRALKNTHPLIRDPQVRPSVSYCFETFPHAIACCFSNQVLSARNKRGDRRDLLEDQQITGLEKAGIDFVDAALCAFTAYWFASDQPTQAFGEPSTGFIIVPVKKGGGCPKIHGLKCSHAPIVPFRKHRPAH
ncbi:MAG TPA: DUF429 domain-containing protein [Verrucomicrobiales bacterium]|nr:DUF429 domain-containing protein [Verrucomicrobiales bacterium]